MSKCLDFSGLTYLVSKLKTLINNKADKNHVHNYAGSDIPGGIATNADMIDGLHANDFFSTLKGTISTLFTPYEEGTWYVSNGDNTFPYPYGLLEIRYGSYSGEYTATYKTTGDNFKLYYNGWKDIWVGWKDVASTNADTVDGLHAWQMQTLDANGNVHVANDWIMQIRHNVDGDGYFKLFCGNGSVGTKVDMAHASNYSTSATASNSISSTGFGNNTLTYYQTDGDFYGNTGWCHYIIANHGDGATYYNYTIGLPFWSSPMYKRQTGNTSATYGWYRFYTEENITYGTGSLTPGSSSLATGNIYLQYE